MNASRNPWDEDYKRRGRLWGGSAFSLPRLPQSLRILELGCGDGKTAVALVRAGCSLTAIDISPHAVFLCRNTCPDPDRVRIVVADSRKTPFRDESFEVIMAFHIAGHLTRADRRQLAGEIVRLLAPGGTLYFCDFSAGDFRYGRGTETEAGTFARKNGITTHYFTNEEVLTLFTNLTVQSLVQHQWEMQIRGKALPRAEIVAEFKKTA